LGIATGLMGKVARDVVLLAQTEVGECAEGGDGERGGSSAMPHKHNPVGAIGILACAGQAPGLVAGVLAALVAEHERAAGAWQSEWEPLLRLLTLTGSAAVGTAEVLEGLRVDPARMRANLAHAGTGLMTESVVGALAEHLGRADASERVRAATRRARDEGRPLAEVLADDADIAGALGSDGLRAALDPERYLGVADALVQRALA
jgi:3-carboxy-cis,cis-muconate cycloisomerase